MPAPYLTEAQVRVLAPDRVVRRAEACCRSGGVSELAWRGDVLHGTVRDDDRPHDVRIALRRNRLLTYCDCPAYDEWGAWCEHTVAVLLAHARGAMEIQEQPAVRELLAPLEPGEVVRIVELLAERVPRGYELLRDEALKQLMRRADPAPSPIVAPAERIQRTSTTRLS
jgi:uncharacterized Zn finger protein